ncbi:branched-chain amino acid ABC transporter permease [Natronorubrum halophilum]|uniref:branched-chain amino acid ABC transporter permease n=1 Tax=Natronorubrum halophilum TaxID=1702106 RepID=UPI000EF6819D|nr:branched-chain amino acid ABC transporter permease [Natronorubrum halophilum]
MNRNYYHLAIVALVLALIPPLFFAPGMSYIARIFILMALYAILTTALNIVFGHTDQLLLFTGAVAAIGAYTTALGAQWLGVSPWITLLLGASFAGIVGIVVTYVAAIRNLTVIVISILTLALQFSLIELINSLRDITGGVTGLVFNDLRIRPLENLPWFTEDIVLFYTLGAILLALLALYQYLMNSKYGLAFEMIRQDETAAKSIGLNVVKYKVIAGFIATFAIGLAGPFFGQLSGFIGPGTFTFNNIDVMILIMLIVGGLRTMYGPLIGAAVIIYLNEQLRNFAEYRSILFGLLLMALFLYFRQGLVPFAERYLDKYGVRQRATDLLVRS